MHRIFITAGLLLATSLPTATVHAQTSETAPAYNVETTDIGTLLDDPAARTILDKHLPGFSANEQIGMARGMTLKAVQQYASDMVTDKALAAIQNDLSKLPALK
ncbi:hypothetical protein MOK15_18405 [Sphingobium sp. BYY-5]|uniref:hypothetical protein n=1 Tax=Sphingobium sp. BYY-5 TaxID=2926400 RepID=UPI001FA6E5BF|nr:hypothetical protein [Sphingobium sp. BYY-5]MCI4592063.1 hypothetical protein [Sphingobium sp. BYY-5]